MIPYFDAHCDTATECDSIEQNHGQLDAKRLSAFSPSAQIFAICYTKDMSARCAKRLPELKREIDASKTLKLCRCADDIRGAEKEGKTAALIAIEGAEHFDCSLNGLRKAYELGVRSVNITWNYDNDLSGAAMASGAGLSSRGGEFVFAAQELGVILDMSHISERAFWQVMELSKKPVYASHSDSAALCPAKRNLTDDQFSALVKCGGGAGVNMYSDFIGLENDVDSVIAHIEHFLSLGGEHAVFLGTDFDGIEASPAGISGAEDMSTLYEALLRRNYPEGLVRDIFYYNLLYILERAL